MNGSLNWIIGSLPAAVLIFGFLKFRFFFFARDVPRVRVLRRRDPEGVALEPQHHRPVREDLRVRLLVDEVLQDDDFAACAYVYKKATFRRNRRESAKRPKKGGIREKSPTQAGPAAGRGVRACTRRPRCVGRGKVRRRREAAERRRDMTCGERLCLGRPRKHGFGDCCILFVALRPRFAFILR